MASFNRVVLVGNLTRDVELKYLPSGMAVTEVGLAVNDRRKTPSGEWVEEPVFVDITFWGRTAEIAAEYLGKGSSILVEGRLKYDAWEKEGKKFSKLRVVGEKLQMLGQKLGGGGRGNASPSVEDANYSAAVSGKFSSPSPRGRSGVGGGNGGAMGGDSAALGAIGDAMEGGLDSGPDSDLPF